MTARARGTGSLFKPKGSRYWWIAYTSGGKRRFESSRSTRKQDAQALLTDRLGDTGKGIVHTGRTGRITIAQALSAVVDDLRMNGRESVAHTERRITKHVLFTPRTADTPEHGYFHPDRRLTTVTTTDLTAYSARRLDQGAAPASVNHELAIIRRAFRLATRAQEIASVPFVPMLALNNRRKGFLERRQFEAVRDAIAEPLRGVVTLAYLTGWRRAEVVGLQWSQVDRATRTIRLNVGETKNREGRLLPYDQQPELIDVIDRQWHEHERLMSQGVICPHVFHRGGTPIRDFRSAWQRACETAGCPGRLFHDCRRSAVRNFERAGVSRSAAMQITGHKTESVYRRYAIVSEGDLREALGKVATAHQPPPPGPGRVEQFRKPSGAKC